MQDENGKILSDRELLKESLDRMAEALCFMFETTSPQYHALCFILDSAIKLGTVIYNDGSILDASANWEQYEQELYDKFCRLKVIK